jgi:phospholipase/carboxylesterase
METDIPLHYVLRENKDKQASAPLLILLHGHGSHEHDLFSWHSQIPETWIVVSVRAPYKLQQGSYRWYEVMMVQNKITINTEEEVKSRKLILQLLDEIKKKYQVNSRKIIVAGFSQGANMAATVSLTSPEKIAGFAVFSGRFVNEIKPYISTSDSLHSLKCFLAHGNKDQMLPISYADENRQALQRLGISVTYAEDAVGHSITSKQLEAFVKWLNQW